MEWVDLKSGKPQTIQGMHTYPTPNVSTQTTDMDLRSGSKDLTVPSLMFMRMLWGTFLPHGNPFGIPLDHVGEASQSVSPSIDQARSGVMEEKATALWEEGKGRISLPTNKFGMHNVKEEISNKASTTIDASVALSLLSCVDPYWRSQLLVEYSKVLHTGIILDGMKQGGGYVVHEEVIYHHGKVFLSQTSKRKRYYREHTKSSFLAICSQQRFTP